MRNHLCKSCRHYQPDPVSPNFWHGKCASPKVKEDLHSINICFDDQIPMLNARASCRRAIDGHFVYFEPKTPAAGAFVEITRDVISDAANVMVASGILASDQLTNETKVEVLKKMAAAA